MKRFKVVIRTGNVPTPVRPVVYYDTYVAASAAADDFNRHQDTTWNHDRQAWEREVAVVLEE